MCDLQNEYRNTRSKFDNKLQFQSQNCYKTWYYSVAFHITVKQVFTEKNIIIIYIDNDTKSLNNNKKNNNNKACCH